MQVRSDQTYEFNCPPDHLWDVLVRVDSYQRWWPWLRHFDPGPVAPGARWSCVVQPPLPYAVTFDLVIAEVVVGRSISAVVEGGLHGDAHLELTPTSDGSSLHLSSSLSPENFTLRTVARLAPPVARFGHDWVLDTGLRQFSTRALGEDPGRPAPG